MLNSWPFLLWNIILYFCLDSSFDSATFAFFENFKNKGDVNLRQFAGNVLKPKFKKMFREHGHFDNLDEYEIYLISESQSNLKFEFCTTTTSSNGVSSKVCNAQIKQVKKEGYEIPNHIDKQLCNRNDVYCKVHAYIKLAYETESHLLSSYDKKDHWNIHRWLLSIRLALKLRKIDKLENLQEYKKLIFQMSNIIVFEPPTINRDILKGLLNQMDIDAIALIDPSHEFLVNVFPFIDFAANSTQQHSLLRGYKAALFGRLSQYIVLYFPSILYILMIVFYKPIYNPMFELLMGLASMLLVCHHIMFASCTIFSIEIFGKAFYCYKYFIPLVLALNFLKYSFQELNVYFQITVILFDIYCFITSPIVFIYLYFCFSFTFILNFFINFIYTTWQRMNGRNTNKSVVQIWNDCFPLKAEIKKVN